MAEFTLGARASCPDGFCGVVSRTILDPAEETELVDGGYGDVGAMGMGGSVPGMGLGYSTPLVVEHAVPLGDIKVERHESVHAIDGHTG